MSVIFVILFLSLGMLPAGVFSQGASLDAEILEGSCQQPASLAFDLQPPTISSGTEVGAADAIPAATSFTPAPTVLDALLASEHVVALSSGNQVVACGPIGGDLETDGSLGVVIQPMVDNGPDGVAYFDPAGDVSLFIDPKGFRASAVAPTTAAEPANTTATNANQTQAQGIVAAPVAPAPAAPAAAVAPGAGATAKCNDGTFSYAAHHQGACSSHGGVAIFYK